MVLQDTAILDLPADKSFLDWWFECIEINPDAPEPLYTYSLYVDFNKEVSDWCDSSLTAAPDFDRCSFVVDESILTEPLAKAFSRYNATIVRLKFLTNEDLIHFKMRWL